MYFVIIHDVQSREFHEIVRKMLTKNTNELLYFVISHNAVLTKIGHDVSGSKIEVHIIKKKIPKIDFTLIAIFFEYLC